MLLFAIKIIFVKLQYSFDLFIKLFNGQYFLRRKFEKNLVEFSRRGLEKKTKNVKKNVLVDGLWDNPNYWFRYALIRKSLGLSNWSNTGLLGKYSRTMFEKLLNAFVLMVKLILRR